MGDKAWGRKGSKCIPARKSYVKQIIFGGYTVHTVSVVVGPYVASNTDTR